MKHKFRTQDRKFQVRPATKYIIEAGYNPNKDFLCDKHYEARMIYLENLHGVNITIETGDV